MAKTIGRNTYLPRIRAANDDSFSGPDGDELAKRSSGANHVRRADTRPATRRVWLCPVCGTDDCCEHWTHPDHGAD
jgi:hypothetical protein